MGLNESTRMREMIFRRTTNKLINKFSFQNSIIVDSEIIYLEHYTMTYVRWCIFNEIISFWSTTTILYSELPSRYSFEKYELRYLSSTLIYLGSNARFLIARESRKAKFLANIRPRECCIIGYILTRTPEYV